MRVRLILWAVLAGGASWALAVGGHEALGHGGACAIDTACRWAYIDAMYFDGEWLAPSQRRWELMAGPLFNLVLGFLAIAGLGLRQVRESSWALLMWMLIPANWVQGGAYLGLASFIHPGMDWAQLATMWAPSVPSIRLVFLGLGAIWIGLGLIAIHRLVPPAARQNPRLVLAAGLMGCAVTALLAGGLVPGPRSFLLMGAFGSGVVFLSPVWISLAVMRVQSASVYQQPRLAILVLQASVILAYVAVLGPGLTFR